MAKRLYVKTNLPKNWNSSKQVTPKFERKITSIIVTVISVLRSSARPQADGELKNPELTYLVDPAIQKSKQTF